jgi:hypothetical protein
MDIRVLYPPGILLIQQSLVQTSCIYHRRATNVHCSGSGCRKMFVYYFRPTLVSNVNKGHVKAPWCWNRKTTLWPSISRGAVFVSEQCIQLRLPATSSWIHFRVSTCSVKALPIFGISAVLLSAFCPRRGKRPNLSWHLFVSLITWTSMTQSRYWPRRPEDKCSILGWPRDFLSYRSFRPVLGPTHHLQ